LVIILFALMVHSTFYPSIPSAQIHLGDLGEQVPSGVGGRAPAANAYRYIFNP